MDETLCNAEMQIKYNFVLGLRVRKVRLPTYRMSRVIHGDISFQTTGEKEAEVYPWVPGGPISHSRVQSTSRLLLVDVTYD